MFKFNSVLLNMLGWFGGVLVVVKVRELEKRVARLEKLTRDIARALALMAYEREELGEEVRGEVEEALRDYLEGRVNKFLSLKGLEEELLKEK